MSSLLANARRRPSPLRRAARRRVRTVPRRGETRPVPPEGPPDGEAVADAGEGCSPTAPGPSPLRRPDDRTGEEPPRPAGCFSAWGSARRTAPQASAHGARASARPRAVLPHRGVVRGWRPERLRMAPGRRHGCARSLHTGEWFADGAGRICAWCQGVGTTARGPIPAGNGSRRARGASAHRRGRHPAPGVAPPHRRGSFVRPGEASLRFASRIGSLPACRGRRKGSGRPPAPTPPGFQPADPGLSDPGRDPPGLHADSAEPGRQPHGLSRSAGT